MIDYDHDPLSSQEFERLKFPDGASIVHGHVRPIQYSGYDCLVTFLRHPVDLVPALYYAWQNTRPYHDLLCRFHRETPSLIEFAQWDKIRNLLQTYFSGFDMQLFDFIGQHESRACDLARLSALLGAPLDPQVHDNRRRTAHPINADAKNSLLRILADDIAFYDSAFYDSIRPKGQLME